MSEVSSAGRALVLVVAGGTIGPASAGGPASGAHGVGVCTHPRVASHVSVVHVSPSSQEPRPSHAEHVLAPSPLVYVPVGQGRHASTSPGDEVPRGQVAHEARSGDGAVPAGQIAQNAQGLPVDTAPAGHRAQAVSLVLVHACATRSPVPHVAHRGHTEPRSVRPSGHEVQADGPVAEQVAHETSHAAQTRSLVLVHTPTSTSPARHAVHGPHAPALRVSPARHVAHWVASGPVQVAHVAWHGKSGESSGISSTRTNRYPSATSLGTRLRKRSGVLPEAHAYGSCINTTPRPTLSISARYASAHCVDVA